MVHIFQIQIQTLNVQAVDAMATSLSLLPIADKNKESRFEVPNAKHFWVTLISTFCISNLNMYQL